MASWWNRPRIGSRSEAQRRRHPRSRYWRGSGTRLSGVAYGERPENQTCVAPRTFIQNRRFGREISRRVISGRIVRQAEVSFTRESIGESCSLPTSDLPCFPIATYTSWNQLARKLASSLKQQRVRRLSLLSQACPKRSQLNRVPTP